MTDETGAPANPLSAGDAVRSLSAFDRDRTPDDAHTAALLAVQESLMAAAPGDADDPATWPAWAALLPLVEEFTRHRDVLAIEPTATLALLSMAGKYLSRTDQPLPALDLLRRACALADLTVGPSHEWWATSRVNVACAAFELNAFDEAVSAATEVIAAVEAGADCDHERTVLAYQVCGHAQSARADYATAHRMQARALSLLIERHGTQNLHVYDAHSELSKVQAQLGYLADARLNAQHAVAGWQTALGPWHEKVGLLHGNIGRIAQRQGDLPAAREHLAHALRVAQLQPDGAHRVVVVHGSSLAQVLIAMGDVPAVVAVHEAVIGALEAEVGPWHPKVGQVRWQLGNAQSLLGNHGAACFQFERGLAITEATGSAAPELLAQLRAKLDGSRAAFAGQRPASAWVR